MTLTIENVCKRFGTNEVLRGITLEAERGRPLALLGRNGAGKTTLIRIVMGVFPGDRGRVLIDGAPIDRTRLRLGYLPEERGLYPKKIILEQLTYLAALRGINRRDAVRRIDTLLARMDMTEFRARRLDTLSKGNQQKIQLVATLLGDPDILVLDEPFSGFDPVNAALFEDIIREEVARGKVVFLSSHQMNYIEEFCEDLAILRGGQIVLAGNFRAIQRSYPRNRVALSCLEADRLAAYCRTLPFVKDIAVDGYDLMVTLSRPEDKNALLSAVLAQGFDLDEAKVSQPSLQEIFVGYTADDAGSIGEVTAL